MNHTLDPRLYAVDTDCDEPILSSKLHGFLYLENLLQTVSMTPRIETNDHLEDFISTIIH